MVELTILIPVADNEGRLFSADHHRAFEAFAVARFGGITRYGQARGTWVDEGTTYHDTTLVYGVAVPSITAGDKVREMVEFARSHYRQEAIYIRYLGVAEIL